MQYISILGVAFSFTINKNYEKLENVSIIIDKTVKK